MFSGIQENFPEFRKLFPESKIFIPEFRKCFSEFKKSFPEFKNSISELRERVCEPWKNFFACKSSEFASKCSPAGLCAKISDWSATVPVALSAKARIITYFIASRRFATGTVALQSVNLLKVCAKPSKAKRREIRFLSPFF